MFVISYIFSAVIFSTSEYIMLGMLLLVLLLLSVWRGRIGIRKLKNSSPWRPVLRPWKRIIECHCGCSCTPLDRALIVKFFPTCVANKMGIFLTGNFPTTLFSLLTKIISKTNSIDTRCRSRTCIWYRRRNIKKWHE